MADTDLALLAVFGLIMGPPFVLLMFREKLYSLVDRMIDRRKKNKLEDAD